ncbi:MAG TPA: DUF2997 domain-containing protein [Ktedonobacteraceae bacterium]|nr:DUF2997 domain-containing protein [Ktedonobacteraceae bacterium]
MREIEVTINPDGTTKTDFSGFKGPSCLDAAAKLRDLLAQFGIQSEQTGFEAKPELKNAQAETSGQRQQGKTQA